ENGGILAPHHKIEIAFGVGICLGANDAIADALDDHVHRRNAAFTEANAAAQINGPRNFRSSLLYPAVRKRGLVSRLPSGTAARLSAAGWLPRRRRLLAALLLAEAQPGKRQRHERCRDRSNG